LAAVSWTRGRLRSAWRDAVDMMKRILSRRAVLDALLLFALALISLTWFRSAALLWTPDANFPLTLPAYTDRYFELWEYRTIPGTMNVAKLPFLVPWGFLLEGWKLLGLPFRPEVFQRLLLLGLVWGSGLSGCFLFRVVAAETAFSHLQQRVGGLCAGVLYAFNFYSMLTIWSAVSYLMFSYAFLPFVLGLVLVGLRTRRTARFALGIALVWTLLLSLAYTIGPVVVTDWAAVGTVAIVSLYTSGKGLRSMVPGLRFLGIVFGFWVLFNAYWLVNLVAAGGAQLARYPSGTSFFVSNAAPLSEAFRLAGYSRLTGTYHDSPLFPWAVLYGNGWVILIGFLPALLTVLALTSRRRTATMLGLATLVVGALFFVKGGNPPFGGVNEALWNLDGVGIAYRSIYQRFMAYVAVPLAILAPFGALRIAEVVAESWPKAAWRGKYIGLPRGTGPIAACVLVAVLGLAYTLPAVTGDIFENTGVIPDYRVTLPSGWAEVASWLDAQSEDFAILPFPYPVTTARTVLAIDNGSAGFIGLYPLLLSSSRPVAYGPGPGADLAHLLASGELTDAITLNGLNVRYVLVHEDANLGYLTDNPGWVMAPPEDLERTLNSTPGFRFVRAFGPILVFENLRWTPTLLLAFPSADPLREPGPSFLWNGLYHEVQRWGLPAVPANETALVPTAIRIAGTSAGDPSLVGYGVGQVDPTGAALAAPTWVEHDGGGNPSTVWTLLAAGPGAGPSSLFASDTSLEATQPDDIFTFFDSFEDPTLSQWSVGRENWSTREGGVDGAHAVAAGPAPSVLAAPIDGVSGVLEGWFRFDETTTAHFPFRLTEADGGIDEWVVALADGRWGYHDGTAYRPYPIVRTYAPTMWVQLRLEFDLPRGLFWATVDGQLLTPQGLPAANATGQPASRITSLELANAEAGSQGAMWADAVRFINGPTATVPLPSAGSSLDLRAVAVDITARNVADTDVSFDLDTASTGALVWVRGFDAGWDLELSGSDSADATQFAALGVLNGWDVGNVGGGPARIHFAPQAVLVGGLAFSGSAMLAAAGYLVWTTVARRNRRPRRSRTLP